MPSFDDDEGAGRFRREEDAVRPSSPTERRRMRELDDYGHQKLGCEELLVEQRRNGGFPYVVLRLPDVIGPRGIGGGRTCFGWRRTGRLVGRFT